VAKLAKIVMYTVLRMLRANCVQNLHNYTVCHHSYAHITHSSDQSVPLIRLLVTPWLGSTLPPILPDGPSAVFPPLFSCINLFDNAWRYELQTHDILLYVINNAV
jgi:hypothetical protein